MVDNRAQGRRDQAEGAYMRWREYALGRNLLKMAAADGD